MPKTCCLVVRCKFLFICRIFKHFNEENTKNQSSPLGKCPIIAQVIIFGLITADNNVSCFGERDSLLQCIARDEENGREKYTKKEYNYHNFCVEEIFIVILSSFLTENCFSSRFVSAYEFLVEIKFILFL